MEYTGHMAKGSTTRKHRSLGYQDAMLDMARAFESGGEQRARQWIKDNFTSTDHRAKFAVQPTFGD